MNQMYADQNFTPPEGMAIGSELLNGQFLIQACLQQGGFGIAYVARDSLNRQVVVKECFPSGICKRAGGIVQPVSAELAPQFDAIKKQFVREARQMAKLTHPNVLGVHQVFEENNTAYMALDQVEGIDLITLADDHPERLTNGFLFKTLKQMLAAVAFVHANGVLHRDISPDNILVDDNDDLTLIDFGAAQENTVHGAPGVPTIIAVKDGYSPHELYTPNAPHDCSSDLYSLGATLYHLITGDPPPSSEDRVCALADGAPDPYVPLASQNWGYDYNLLATVDRALEVLQERRYATASAWVEALRETPKTRPAAPPKPVFDPMLESKISQIVEVTNTELTPVQEAGSAGAQARRKADLEKAAEVETPKTVVDIFGNPIDDLETWQAEQEQELQAWNNGRETDENAHETNSSRPRKSRLSTLISRCLPGRKPADPTEHQT